MGGEKGRNDTAWPPGRQYARPEIFFYNPPTFYRQAAAMSGWDIRQARDTYNIAHWGGDYFDINADGHLHVRPRRDGRHPGIGLFRLSEEAQAAGLALPRPGGGIICNGYKDREYIRLALIGRRLSHRVYIVVEKLSELDIIIDEA